MKQDIVAIEPFQQRAAQPMPIVLVQQVPAPIDVVPTPTAPPVPVDWMERRLSAIAACIFGGICLIGVGWVMGRKPEAAPVVQPSPSPQPTQPPVIVIDGNKGGSCQMFCFK